MSNHMDNEKTAAGATNTDDGKEQITRSNSAHNPTVIARWHQRGHDTGRAFGTVAGDRVPHKDWVPVLIPRAVFLDAVRGNPVPIVVSPDDVQAHDHAGRARRREKEIEKRVRAKLAEHEQRARAAAIAEIDAAGHIRQGGEK